MASVLPAARPARPWRERLLLRAVLFYWETLLTTRGRALLLVTAALALAGADTRRTQIYLLFAIAAGLLIAASAVRAWPRPALAVECAWPERATAGRPLGLRVRLRALPGASLPGALSVFLRPPRAGPAAVRIAPRERFLVPSEGRGEALFELLFPRRGRYELRGPGAARLDPLGLACSAAQLAPGRTLHVHPRFEPLEDFAVPAGRRYQPGGIPLSSSTGDAIEFVGTRDYRPGDPLKNVHWRSWARRGAPVVKEFQEEYFCRIALVLDTFLPRRARAAERQDFERALSHLAAITDVFSRGEQIVDVLAAGPDLYEVSVGRSLAYLENILDVLACLEPCPQPPFAGLGPALFDKLAQTTSVVAVMLDWDEAREGFLRRVRALGVSVRGVIVRSSATTRDWRPAAGELDLSLLAGAADAPGRDA